MIRLLPAERQAVAQYIYSICGIQLDASKDYLIESRLSGIMTEVRCDNFLQLVSRSRADPHGAIKRKIIDEITTGETLFFRDSAPFDLLRHKILPELIDRRARANSRGSRIPIRIWSAACSTGQELYSTAIVLRETVPDLSQYNVRLVGTDISDRAIARASQGIFSDIEIARGVDNPQRDRWFTRQPKGWRVRDEIRAMVSFRKQNLMEDLSALGTFDVILCRNVAIYFNDTDKILLFNRLEQRMEKDGFLIVGSMESLNSICPRFAAKRHLRSVYYQLQSALIQQN